MSTRLIIAVDYDGTIANTNAEAMKWIKTHVGRDVEPWQCNRTDCVPLIGKSPYEEMNDYVYERESTLAAAEVPGATVPTQWRFPSTAEAVRFMKDSYLDLQHLMTQLSETERELAWTEIEQQLSQFEGPNGFEAPGEVLMGVGTK